MLKCKSLLFTRRIFFGTFRKIYIVFIQKCKSQLHCFQVPTLFKQHQIDATQKSAELAGFKYCKLLQEPIAASIAYGLSTHKTDGDRTVFDFGGGTFDAALVNV